MNWQTLNFDWNHVRAFLVAAEEGSLTAASKKLNQTQPTTSRQITALEEDLGVILFERGQRSLSLTCIGEELLSYVKHMADAANRMSLAVSGAKSVSGEVCVTVSEMLAFHFPNLLNKFYEQYPDIRIRVISSNDVIDIYQRDADIALRHFRPTQQNLIARNLCTLKGGLYASTAYIDMLGGKKNLQDYSSAKFIGFQSLERTVEVYKSLGMTIDAANIPTICNNVYMGIELIRNSLGIAPLLDVTADLFKDLEPLFLGQQNPELPVWLTTHRELHTSPRIRAVFDFIANYLIQEFSNDKRLEPLGAESVDVDS